MSYRVTQFGLSFECILELFSITLSFWKFSGNPKTGSDVARTSYSQMEGNISSVSAELRHRVFAQDRWGGGGEGMVPNQTIAFLTRSYFESMPRINWNWFCFFPTHVFVLEHKSVCVCVCVCVSEFSHSYAAGGAKLVSDGTVSRVK